MKIFIVLGLVAFLSGCETSMPSHQRRAEKRAEALLTELQEVKRRDQLLASQERIAKAYRQLAEALVEAEQYRKHHPEEGLAAVGDELGTQLKRELQRLYAMEGGRELLESAQEEALEQLASLDP
jgi:hypothetical protein